MHKRIVFQLFCILVLIGCPASKKEDDSTRQQFLSWLLASGSNPACVEYYTQENLCLKHAVSISEKCSAAELDRLQSGIQPAKLQTRETLEELLRCWGKCNSTFYVTYSSTATGNCSFDSETNYVDAKRSGATNAGNVWRQCQSNCNTGADPGYPKLNGISTSTTYWPYP
ncbi:hypothetical protein CH375_00240 [Leptospira ellisii]|uniref:Lipoprotein n=1 Tax=Leptospira ellisii TaxID=2023197 RepID=A0A2N0B3X2_9LEPT|nr:hypothetical protein CH379_19780 [Leptospira ellisii]PKA06362.1 hypothetical protein CH375_00240 [Leptospira ellisii]